MNHVYLALGSNRGDRENHLHRAAKLLREKAGNITRVSSVYETQPWKMNGPTHFLNQVLLLETFLDAPELMSILLNIEESMGRKRNKTSGYEARDIDIDMLFFNNDIIQNDSLIIPHPEIMNRRFVLEPLAEIAPGYLHPQLKKPVTELLSGCNDEHSVKKFVLK